MSRLTLESRARTAVSASFTYMRASIQRRTAQPVKGIGEIIATTLPTTRDP